MVVAALPHSAAVHEEPRGGGRNTGRQPVRSGVLLIVGSTCAGQACLAEAIGTFVIVLFGTGSVHTAVLFGAQAGLWQVAIVWALAVAFAITLTADRSGAHLNPAITVAMATFRGFPLGRVIPYIAAQVAGAFCASALLYLLFGNALAIFEAAKHVTRGDPGSVVSAMCYGEYFPCPGPCAPGTPMAHAVSKSVAFLAELVGTAFLSLVIFAVTDESNEARPRPGMTPFAIGLAVAMIISIAAPLTQAGLNPARDFGPRLFAFLAGWGSVAIPGPRGGFFSVYILAPIIGALIGGAVWNVALRKRSCTPGAQALA